MKEIFENHFATTTSAATTTMASNDEHNDVAVSNNADEEEKTDDKPKQKMSARYNLFRYKSKDISDMSYNCKFKR